MARGDIKWFRRAILDLGSKLHDLPNDQIMVGICNNTLVPTVDTADPRWGAGGGTNLSTNQVALATGYAGPVALASKTWTQVANVPTLRAAILTIAQDAGGFSDGYWAFLFNNTDAGKRALLFMDLGGPVGNVNGPVDLDWNGVNNDIATLTQA